MSASYCAAVRNADPGNPHRLYHDSEYGFRINDDNALLARLALEINQAGLSWTIILNKRSGFDAAFEGFDVDRVAGYTDADRARLLANAGIVRNRLKVNAVIENARRIVTLRGSHGSFAGWLHHHHPRSLDEWKKLFKRTFVFTGGEIVREFLVSTGYLPGAHDADCPIFDLAAGTSPAWMSVP